MSKENVKRTRAYFEEIARASREDFDPETTISRMAEFWDPQIEWDTRGGPVLEIAGVYHGVQDAWTWCREWFTAWEALHFEYELVDAGDRVVARSGRIDRHRRCDVSRRLGLPGASGAQRGAARARH